MSVFIKPKFYSKTPFIAIPYNRMPIVYRKYGGTPTPSPLA